jgi:serine protease
MSEQTDSPRKGRNWLWLLVLVAVVALWWFTRPPRGEQALLSDPSSGAASEAGLDADPDDILLDLRDDVSGELVADIERTFGIDLELVSDQAQDERLYRAHVDPARQAELLAALARHPAVEIAEPDALVQLFPVESSPDPAPDESIDWADYPNDPMYKYQWHMRQIGMPEAWKLADGAGVIVAVIDTGVAHARAGRFSVVPDLDGIAFVKPYNFVANNDQAHDDHGHGTHVAGTIAQLTNNGIGVAGIGRKVQIMPLKVLSASGSGSVASISDAIHYAADNGAKVINMSLGGRFPSRVLKKAVEYAHGKGVTVVCAAGNDGRGKVSYPAAYPGSFAVAATQFDESTTFYSNWGKEIDIAAPGGNTRVDQNEDGMPDGVVQNTIVIGDPTKNDYFPYMGTSMASPHIAGVAALVVGEGVTEPKAVEQILQETARRPQGSAKYEQTRYGAGIVDAPAAVRKARGASGAWQLLLGLLIAGGVASSVRRRGLLAVALGPSYLAGVIMGASGLFFLPYLSSWLGGSIEALPLGDILSRGLPSWDLAIFGPAGHGNALFFSALIPMALITGLYGARRLRAPLAGLAAGVAGHLLFHTIVRLIDIQYIPNMFDEMWLAVNALACTGLGYLVLRR